MRTTWSASCLPTRSAPIPAGCGISRTNEKMDKDRFRRDLGKVEEAYQEVARRLGILIDQGPGDVRGPTTLQ